MTKLIHEFEVDPRNHQNKKLLSPIGNVQQQSKFEPDKEVLVKLNERLNQFERFLDSTAHRIVKSLIFEFSIAAFTESIKLCVPKKVNQSNLKKNCRKTALTIYKRA